MTRVEVADTIDVLDRAERAQTDQWRRPLAALWETLHKAQRTRRWIATPLLALAVALPSVVGISTLSTHIMITGIVGTFSLFAMQRVLERLMPVLEREERIKALQSYFFAWTDYDDREDRTPA